MGIRPIVGAALLRRRRRAVFPEGDGVGIRPIVGAALLRLKRRAVFPEGIVWEYVR
jgi:hypothetical protein